MEEADWAVMEVLQDELLDPAIVTAAVQQAAAELTVAPSDLRPQLDANRRASSSRDNRHRASHRRLSVPAARSRPWWTN